YGLAKCESRIKEYEYVLTKCEYRLKSCESGLTSLEYRLTRCEYRLTGPEYGLRRCEYRLIGFESVLEGSDSALTGRGWRRDCPLPGRQLTLTLTPTVSSTALPRRRTRFPIRSERRPARR